MTFIDSERVANTGVSPTSVFSGIGSALVVALSAGSRLSLQDSEGIVVVGFRLDLGNDLGVDNASVRVDDDDGACEQTRERTICHGHTVGGSETGLEHGAGDDVIDTLGGAEPGRREGKVCGHADHRGVIEPGGSLVELANGIRAHAGVQAGKDVEDDSLARKRVVGDVGEVGPRDHEVRSCGSHGGELPNCLDGISFKCGSSHTPIV